MTYKKSVAVAIAVAIAVAVPPPVRMMTVAVYLACLQYPQATTRRGFVILPRLDPPRLKMGTRSTVVGSIPWALWASPVSSPWTSTGGLARSPTPSSRRGRAGRSANIGDQTCGTRSRLVQTGTAYPVDVKYQVRRVTPTPRR